MIYLNVIFSDIYISIDKIIMSKITSVFIYFIRQFYQSQIPKLISYSKLKIQSSQHIILQE